MRFPGRALVVLVVSVVLGLAACGGTPSSGTPTGTSTPASGNPGSAAPSVGTGEKFKIAFLNPSASNTYLAQTWNAIDEVANEHGADATQFDAQFDVARQQEQLQNIVASGQYDGIIISAVTEAVIVDVTAAAKAGLTVVAVGNILGPKLDTPDPQVDGVSLSVAAPHTEFGARLGTLAKEACADKNPCRVVYFWGIKGQPTDVARFEAFKESIKDQPTIQIVAEIEDQYATDTALAEIQNLLQTTSEFDVVVGTDQSVKGAQIALEEAGKLESVALIGLGGSEAAVSEVKAGTWFGGVMTAPRTEGLLAAKGMFELLETGQLSTANGLNPLDEVPNGGLFKSDNVGDIVPEWAG